MDEIIRLRHELHRNPELSGKERATGKRIRFFLNRYRPNILHTGIAGEGMAAIFTSSISGPTLLFRCDMDALPIHETTNAPHRSCFPGISHACGHDGHIAMVSALAKTITENPLKRGKAILFYQPEEETGYGALRSIRSMREMQIIPDYAFALHNMPKYPFGSIVLSQRTFAAASKGLVVKLTGKSSHAAYPENGINPAPAIAQIIQGFDNLNGSKIFSDYTLITIIHVNVGEIAFGTSPGYGELRATLRAFADTDMSKLTERALDIVRNVGLKHNLVVETSYDDDFPATVNDLKLTEVVRNLAIEKGFRIVDIEQPNRWSEDFAHFTVRGPAILFGLGVGENHPNLHSPDYDFPDEVLPTGVEILDSIVTHFLR